MSIEKLTLIKIFPIESFAEIDKSFNWINSFKTNTQRKEKSEV